MIVVESIQWGPELARAPVTRVLSELGKVTKEIGTPEDTALEFLYDVPGSLGGPTFAGSKVVVASRAQGRVRIHVAVPQEVASSPEPLEWVVALAETALRSAAEKVSWLPLERALETLGLARNRLIPRTIADPSVPRVEAGQQSPARLQDKIGRGLRREIGRPDGAPADERQGERSDIGSDAGAWSVEIHIPLDHRTQSIAFEEALTEAIEASGAGVVDGNEMDQHELVIFVGTESPYLVRDALAVFLAADSRTAARVSLVAYGEEGKLELTVDGTPLS